MQGIKPETKNKACSSVPSTTVLPHCCFTLPIFVAVSYLYNVVFFLYRGHSRLLFSLLSSIQYSFNTVGCE